MGTGSEMCKASVLKLSFIFRSENKSAHSECVNTTCTLVNTVDTMRYSARCVEQGVTADMHLHTCDERYLGSGY